MKTIKPRKLGLLTRPFENDRKFYLAAAILAFFPLNQPAWLLSEQKLWQFVPEQLGGAVFDEGLPKQNGEVLVWGSCHCPRQRPRPACPVTVKIGSINKTLNVFGDRFWKKKGRSNRAGEPRPFTSLAVSYENAFGGRDYPLNPLGKGLAPVPDQSGHPVHPLPNIEHPDHLIGSPDDRPTPAGFGPLDLTWPQRAKKAGHYDPKWLKERFPGYPADMDWTIFNQAPPDQQINGFFQGDETIALENMHPNKPVQNSSLPRLTARCFINHTANGQDNFREIPTRLDTVWLFPEAEKGVVVFRGVFETLTDDAEDVRHMLVAAEALDDPRPEAYYRRVLAQRTDRKKGHLFALRDQDLLPPEKGPAPAAARDAGDLAKWLAGEDLLRKNVGRGAEKEFEKARRALAARGLDPDLYLSKKPPEDEPIDLDRVDLLAEESEEMIARGRKEAEDGIARAEQQFRAMTAGLDLDADQYLEEARRQAARRPKFKAADVKAQLKACQRQMTAMGKRDPAFDRLLDDPKIDKKLVEMEQMLEQGYRRYAQHFPAAALPPADQARGLGREVLAALQNGQKLDGRDLTGIDLSDCRLAGASFKNTVLEGADLSGADLTGADLSGAVLVRADLTRANLGRARLKDANLALANLTGAVLNQKADLTGATLNQADLTGADLTGANFSGADLSEAVLKGTDFSGASTPGMVFMDSILESTVFRGTDLSKSNFINVNLTEVDFTGARMTSATFLKVRAEGVVFQGAMMVKFRATGETCLAGTDFTGADLTTANLRGVDLDRCKFTQALLAEADLSSASLKGADLYRARARGARFIKANLDRASLIAANLWGANFQNARIHGTSFKGANLYAANFLRAKADQKTDFTDALLNKAFFKG